MHAAYTEINSQITNPTAIQKTLAHEIGHTFGLDHCDPVLLSPFDACSPDKSTMTLPPGGTPFNNTQYGTTGPTSCDNENIKAAGNYNSATVNQEVCPINARPGNIAGTFPVTIGGYGGYQTVTHEIQIFSYNLSTGAITVKLTDYYATRANYSSAVTNSTAPSAPYVVVDNTDPCFNADGTVMNVTIGSNGNPTFGCTFTKQVSLTYTGTETITLPNGNSGAFRKVYTGQITAGSGVPYKHFINYSPYNNYYSYAHN